MKKLICFIILLILPAAVFTDDEVFFMIRMDPSIMLILDSSGSMTWDMAGNATCGDGSIDYEGRDTDGDLLPNDSRLYIVKAALRNVVTVNTEFQYGLMTYGQIYTWTDAYYYYPYYYSNWYWPYYCNCTWNWYPPYSTWYGYYRTAYLWWWGMTWPTSYPDYAHYPLRVPIGPHTPAHTDSIIAWIDNDCGYPSLLNGDHEIRACGSTPIGGSLYWVLNYYQSYILQDPAKNCRRYFVLLVSDGEEEEWTLNPYTWAANLRHTPVGGETYDVQTFALGIGGNMVGSPMLDSIAKLGGTQHAYFATTPGALDSTLAAILGDILQRSFSFSAPEVPAVRVKQQDKLYMGSFLPSYDVFWKGYLRCYRLAPDGTFPVDSQGVPLEEPIWEAGSKLQATSSISRMILTEMGGTLVPFISSQIPADTLGVDNDSVAAALIDWVRGDNGKNWKLGDLFHSQPLAIMSPNPYYFEEGYNEFKITYANRDRIILVGSNDGMLHAFEAGEYTAAGDSFTDGTGDEVWAYIPHNLLSKLKDMRNSHQYMVDASPSAAGVWIPSGPSDTTKDADEWKTVLVCGERGGGNYYFSLDITDTHNPSYMWEFTDTELGETWSEPIISKVGIPRDKWVAVFGGGYYADNEKGKALYFLDISNGDIVFKYDSTDNDSIQYSFPSSPTGIDLSPIDNFMDRVYIGDVGGQMWRFDVSDSDTSSWTGRVIFTSQPIAPRITPIFYPPSLSYDEEGNLWVFFGTGDRENPRDTSSHDRFYGVIDRGNLLRESDLAEITGGVNPPSDDGWLCKLEKGEKVLAGSAVVGGIVYFTTYKPTVTDDPCEIQGLARLHKIEYLTGTHTFESIGTSLPTTPQVSISPEGELTIMITLAEGKIYTETVETGVPLIETQYWREIRP